MVKQQSTNIEKIECTDDLYAKKMEVVRLKKEILGISEKYTKEPSKYTLIRWICQLVTNLINPKLKSNLVPKLDNKVKYLGELEEEIKNLEDNNPNNIEVDRKKEEHKYSLMWIILTNNESNIDFDQLEKFEMNEANISKIIWNIRVIIFNEAEKWTKIDNSMIKKLIDILIIPTNKNKEFSEIKDLYQLNNFILWLTTDDVDKLFLCNQLSKQSFIDSILNMKALCDLSLLVDLEWKYNQFYNTKK